MITIKEALKIHDLAIQKYGGGTGVRDLSLLESSINRPFATFDSRELYPLAADKAAAIIESIVKNHPFADGNKRTGYILMRLFLLKNQKDIEASQEEKYEFVINIASGKIDYDEIRNWIENRIVNKE